MIEVENLTKRYGGRAAVRDLSFTLAPGDLLLIGVAEQPARARVGDTMAVEIDGIGRLENPLQAETAAVQEAA